MTVNQLYDNYKNFFLTENNTQKYVTKIEFGKRMKEHNLNYYKSKLNNKCVNKYNITFEELKTISDRGHWVHELDTVIDNDEIIIGQNILPESFQYKYIQASQQLSDACDEIAELRIEIEELKKNKAKKVIAKNEYLGITTDDIAEITNIRKIKIRKKSEDIDISNIITCLGIDDESDDEL